MAYCDIVPMISGIIEYTLTWMTSKPSEVAMVAIGEVVVLISLFDDRKFPHHLALAVIM